MQATTIKLEYPILSSLMRFIPKEKSLSAFVLEILESNPEEREWLKVSST